MSIKRIMIGYTMIFPAIAIVLLFVYWPSLNALYYSLTDWNGSVPANFIGLSNYKEMVKDPVLLRSFLNVALLFILGFIAFPIMAFVVAELIHYVTKRRWKRMYQVIFVLPIMVPAVVSIYVGARVLFDSEYGLVNSVISQFTENTPNWLGDENLALITLFLMGFPFVHGIFVLMILAGLQGISSEVQAAAKLEGVTVWQRFWLIDLPLLKPQLKTVAFLLVIWTFQNFTQPLALTKGGPNNSTTFPAYELYRDALTTGRIGYSNAIGVMLFIIIFGLTLLLTRKKNTDGA